MAEMGEGILLIGGGILQIPAIQIAKDAGLNVFVTDKNSDCPARPYATAFFELSTKDIPGHISLAKKLKKEEKLAGVYTQGCDVEYVVAMTAQAVGLPGIPPEAALNCQNKLKMREILRAAGVDDLPFGGANSAEEAVEVAKKVGFPCILKPLDNSASRGVTKVYGPKEIVSAFRTAAENCLMVRRVIIEKLLTGVEYSVDTVMHKGELFTAGISERIFRKDNKFATQIGAITPCVMKKNTEKEIYVLMGRAAHALGVMDGAFKGDLILPDSGTPRIIEVTARTSGGFDSQYRKPYSFGINILKCTMDIALGRSFDPSDLVPKWSKWSMTTSVFPTPGRVTDIKGVYELKKIPGVRNVFINVKVGDVVEPFINCAKRVNAIILSANTYPELLATEEQVQRTLRIVTTPIASLS